jgi:hypothetical protein
VAVGQYITFEMPTADAGHETYSRVKQLAREMHDEICREGNDQRLGRFVEYYGGQALDASLLLLPLMGFLLVDHERIARITGSDISDTDFPLLEITLHCANDVIHLPSEYDEQQDRKMILPHRPLANARDPRNWSRTRDARTAEQELA